MRISRALLAIFLFTCLPAQEPNQPYFSLSSSKTYAPGEKPAIQMWSQNVDTLEFRVYRVRDPILFFQKLEDVHRFGTGAAPRRSNKELTLIERFHALKLRARTAVRNGLRAQYTPDSREAIRAFVAARNRQPVAPATSYAGLPLLNQQQVVSVWRQNVSKGRRWESESIPIPVNDKALYLVEAAHETLSAYNVVIVTDLAIVSKTEPGRVVSLLTNLSSRDLESYNPLWVCRG